MTTAIEMNQEALERATSNTSEANYPAIFEGFGAKGIPSYEIIPRVNVLTYKAWRAKGRQVMKGQKGVKVKAMYSYNQTVENSDGTSESVRRTSPKMTTVFHVSQTKEIE